MKKKKFSDFAISCFLISSLAFGAFLVSCSEEGGLLTGPGTSGNDPTGISGTSSGISSLFLSLGKGAAGEVGGELAGWTLGAMGLATSSGPNYQKEINTIIDELNTIITILTEIDNELTTINSTLINLDCHTQQSTLLNEIAAIKSAYQNFQSFALTGSQGDTLPVTELKMWADQVIQGSSSYMALQTALNNITTSLESTGGPIISCIQVAADPLTEGALGVDTSYYNKVNYYTNYYYYYETVALMMISEAHHFYAWYTAGQPGGSYTSADSVQLVCGENATSQNHCNNVAIQTNDLYNQLLKQMTDGGSRYTGEDLVFQYSSSKPLVWVSSFEDFTSASGSNCTSPLTNTNLCGPTVGYYYSTLSNTIYDSASGFGFASASDLSTLIDVNKASSYSSNGQYLEANGFKNMSNKTVISTDSVFFKLPKANHHISCIPFLNLDIPPVNNYAGDLTSVFITADDFGYVLYPHQTGSFTCGTMMGYHGKDYHYLYGSELGAKDPWAISYAKVATCSDGSYPTSFEWTNSGFGSASFPGPPSYWPGWLSSSQYPHTGIEARRFLWPILYPQNAACTNGRSPLNKGQMPTRCGDDFTAFLNINVPRPPTCDIANIPAQCTVLN